MFQAAKKRENLELPLDAPEFASGSPPSAALTPIAAISNETRAGTATLSLVVNQVWI
jgi:hypothetical protein